MSLVSLTSILHHSHFATVQKENSTWFFIANCGEQIIKHWMFFFEQHSSYLADLPQSITGRSTS